MALATATPDGRPSVRIVLLKGIDDDGIRFYTNYDSRKGRELAANPRAAATLYWQPLQRAVRLEGPVERLTGEESDAYFATRSRGSQLGAWASPQSQEVSSRAELDEMYRGIEQRFAASDDVPLPPQWGGFRVRPDLVEFWQGRVGRMHDRLVYRRAGEGWVTSRLAP